MSEISESFLGEICGLFSFPANEEKSLVLFPQGNDLQVNKSLNGTICYPEEKGKKIEKIFSRENKDKIFELLFGEEKNDLDQSEIEGDYQNKINNYNTFSDSINQFKTEKNNQINRNDSIFDFAKDFLLFYVHWVNKEINKMLRKHGIKNKKLLKITSKYYLFLFNKRDFLSITCKNMIIYSLSKEGKMKNKKIIRRIYEDPEKYKDIILFFEETLEQSLINYYNSDIFKSFKNNNLNKKKNEYFRRQTDISLFDCNGFIRFINSLKENSFKNFV